jgi:hypothetical protein
MTPLMQSPELHATMQKFFDDFVDAFASFNGKIIAARYQSPYLAYHAYGDSDVFASNEATAAYFQGIVDGYYAQGCRSCRYLALEVFPLGPHCAVGTVTWELLSAQGAVISAWRESYNLCRVDGQFLVFASTDHPA